MVIELFDILFLIIIFLSNIIQAVTGFAGTVLAMPFSIKLEGYNVARPVLNLVAVVVCLIVAVSKFKSIDFKELLKMVLFVGLGFVVGYFISSININEDILLKIYGGCVTLIALLFLFVDVNNIKIPDVVLYICLFLGGILHFLYTSGGPLVIIYAIRKIKDKDSFRATLSSMWIILNLIVFGTNLYDGLFTSKVWFLFLLATITCLLSVYIGKLIAKKLSQTVFLKISYVLLLISGVSLLL